MADKRKSSIPLSQNETEIALLKETFADNEELLQAIRKLFLGFKTTTTEHELIQSAFKRPGAKEALRTKIYPIFSDESEIGNLSDFWFGTDVEIVGKDPQTIRQVIQSKQLVLEVVEEAFKTLDNPVESDIDLTYDGYDNDDELGIKLLARNKYIRAIETGLLMIKVIAGQKSETVEEAKNRLLADSAQ